MVEATMLSKAGGGARPRVGISAVTTLPTTEGGSQALPVDREIP